MHDAVGEGGKVDHVLQIRNATSKYCEVSRASGSKPVSPMHRARAMRLERETMSDEATDGCAIIYEEDQSS